MITVGGLFISSQIILKGVIIHKKGQKVYWDVYN